MSTSADEAELRAESVLDELDEDRERRFAARVFDVTAQAPQEEHHPTEWTYVKVGIFLAVVTALEVFTYFESVLDWGDFLVPALIGMMIIKFLAVAGYFMHLRFDSPLFTRVFFAGLILAIAVYIITLATFQFFYD